MTPEINIIIPFYNEEDVFHELITRLSSLMDSFDKTVEVIMVDDGSTDNTQNLIRELALRDNRFQSVQLSRNFGHQTAVTVGMSLSTATEGAMIIDADLQDPPELLHEFYAKFKQGFDVVYGVRKIRRDEGLFKKGTSYWFYRLLKKLSDVDIPLDSGDFCFLSRRVINLFNEMPEYDRFLRGMRAWVGFNQTHIEYPRSERFAGETKYTFKKMWNLALNAIYGFSDLPIKLMTRLGVSVIAISVLYLAYSVIKKIILGNVASGFSGILFSMILFSGVQLLSLGILGQYITRTFFQVKQRPLFIIKEKIKDKQYSE